MNRLWNGRGLGAIAATALMTLGAVTPAMAGEIAASGADGLVPALRFAGVDRFDTAGLIATDDTIGAADFDTDTVLIARGYLFPDALAGSYLSGQLGAPLLLAGTDSLPQATVDAIAALEPSRAVILGKENAVSTAVEDDLGDLVDEVERIGGTDRYATAASLAARGEDAATTAIVANGVDFPDALVSGPIAAAEGLPLLLTRQDALPQATVDALADLGVDSVLVPGLQNAVSDEVVAELEALEIEVTRVGGTDRHETATLLADHAIETYGFATDHVNMARSYEFPDALTLAPHAAADVTGPAPIVLTRDDALPEATEAWLVEHAAPTNVALHVAGGTNAISEEVATAARTAWTSADHPAAFAAQLSGAEAFAHLEAFQQIADDNDDNRASSTAGYDASVEYVQGLLDEAGYVTEVQAFSFDYFEENTPATFAKTAGADAPFDYDLAETPDDLEADFATMSYSGSGDVEGAVVPVDLSVDDPAASTSGCEAEDFDAVDLSGDADVVLVQRGACAFGVKAANAYAAGAEAVIIMNQGDGEGRTEVYFGTLGAPIDEDGTEGPDGPVIGTSFDVGVALSEDPAAEVRITTDTLNEERETSNLLAEFPEDSGVDTENVVMAGAHLDSVPEGPGINDNGSGSAAVLETALKMAELGITPTNQVRFAFWGAEENGLVGSTHYVDEVLINEDFTALTPEGEAVSVYLNFDMVGSPNFARFVYDGDGSTFEVGDAGSGVVEAGFQTFFDLAGLAHEPTEFSGRSDYAEFQVAGIPTGGLFTGAEGVKTEEQAELYGGTAGEAYDPNYHGAGDTIDNVNTEVFDQMLQAIGHETLRYAWSTASIDAAVEAAAAEDGGARAPAAAASAVEAGDHGHAHVDAS